MSKSNPAFSLIEVLVALTILSVGILGVMGGIRLGVQTSADSVRLDDAVAIARRQIELAVSSPPEHLQTLKGVQGQHSWRLTFVDKPHDLILASVVVEWSQRGEPTDFRLSRVFKTRTGGKNE